MTSSTSSVTLETSRRLNSATVTSSGASSKTGVFLSLGALSPISTVAEGFSTSSSFTSAIDGFGTLRRVNSDTVASSGISSSLGFFRS